MSVALRCPACDFPFRVDERFLGRTAVCPRPGCGSRIRLQLPAAAPAAAAPSSAASRQPRAVDSTKAAARPRAAANPAAAVSTAAADAPAPAQGTSRHTAAPAAAPPRPRQRSVATRSSQEPRSLRPALWSFAGVLTVGLLVGAGGLYWYRAGNDAGTSLAAAADDQPLAGSALAAAGEPQFVSAPVQPAVDEKAVQAEAQRQQQLQFIAEKVTPFFTKYCVDCHGPDEQMGGVAVHELTDPDQLLTDRKKWERVYRMVNAGAMPPSGHDPFPTEPEMQEVAGFLHEELFNFDCSLIDHPGRPTIHRLNRAEYNNTVRDLFGISIRPADKFPQDDVGEGFDNIGDVLSIPPLLMEKYLDAAEEVATTVIDTRDFSKPMTQTFRGSALKSSLGTQVDGDNWVMLQSTGNASTEVEILSDGQYRIRIEVRGDQAGDEPARAGLLVDDKSVQEFATERRRPQTFEHELPLTAGRHRLAVAFLNDYYNPDAEDGRKDRNLLVRTIEVTGPAGGGPPAWHETHRRFVTARPDDNTSARQAAQQVLKPILYRAFRRQVSDQEVERYAGLVEQHMTEFQETYEQGLAIALQAILVAPDFLFRREADPEGDAQQRPLNEYEVASRLSYFLWSSMPDDELLQLCADRRLLDRSVLRQQIERMLRDPKAAALGENFAAQWLNLRNLKDVRPNPDVYPDFDDALRNAMARETEVFFNTLVREDRSVDDFLFADYSFVNERLARHYGISGVSGDEFVRVSLAGTNRSGVITQGSVLTLTSNPGRTSPVKRGKWIMENILGEAPPPAPPAVPPLEDTAKASPDLSLREQLALHRADPGCASCHKTMDPLGLGLENFDAVGRWRDRDGDKPVDASGELPSGERFSGSLELIGVFKTRREQFHRALAERMMIYALGRGLEYYDKCAVDKALDLLKERGYRFSSLVEGIVTSDPFLKRSRTREAPLLTRH